MDTKLRVGFIAVGNMGGAIVRGVVRDLLPPEQVWITDVYRPLVDQLCEELGVNSAETSHNWWRMWTVCYMQPSRIMCQRPSQRLLPRSNLRPSGLSPLQQVFQQPN